MDKELFVQNIKERCRAKGVKHTVACREAGVGVSFINDIERGQTPSVAKVQLLAQYLGCTVCWGKRRRRRIRCGRSLCA